jgi:hypothetical protein
MPVGSTYGDMTSRSAFVEVSRPAVAWQTAVEIANRTAHGFAVEDAVGAALVGFVDTAAPWGIADIVVLAGLARRAVIVELVGIVAAAAAAVIAAAATVGIAAAGYAGTATDCTIAAGIAVAASTSADTGAGPWAYTAGSVAVG